MSAERAQETSTFAGRIKGLLAQIGLESQERKSQSEELKEVMVDVEEDGRIQKIAKQEIETLESLLACDDLRQSIKTKLKEHYVQTENVSQERYAQQQKTVQNSMVRNDVFILHTLTSNEQLRHNENSPISARATLEDDLDIALSIEPSLSTSSVSPGKRKELFQENYGGLGVIIGGGEIRAASRGDAGSVITDKGERISSNSFLSGQSAVDQIDGVLNDKEGAYNEVIVDNPKVFGLFKSVKVEKDGSFVDAWPNDFRKHMELARKKGLPPFILTPDRRMFEFVSISDSGKIETGKEIRPEDVAKGNAGLSKEDKKKIGEEVIAKSLFKKATHLESAKAKIASLVDEAHE